MRHLDLFSGIGGFALAVDTVWPKAEHIFCEIEPFCQQVLKKHWPKSKIYDDIKTLNGRQFTAVDLLTGGFPCQPFSQAGKRQGKADDRDLWPEMFRIITEVQPHWVIGENVAGFVNMELDRTIADLESADYEVQAFVIPAVAVGAPHRRDRVWIIANSPGERIEDVAMERQPDQKDPNAYRKDPRYPVDTDNSGLQRHQSKKHQRHAGQSDRNRGDQGSSWNENWYEVATRLCRVDARIPNRVDRLKALGNAIVPQVAIEIMKIIKNLL